MKGGQVRQQQMFNSGERDSGVEHLVHLTKLVGSKSIIKQRGNQDMPHPMSDAMSMRLHRRNLETEKKIREENVILLEKIKRVQSNDDRVARHSTLIPQDQNQHRGFFQGSNQHARTLEAKRIDTDNVHMIARLHDVKPFATRGKDKSVNEKHQQLVNRISKFKPNPQFAGESILRPRRPHHTAPMVMDKETISLKERGWGEVMKSDVRSYHKKRDRILRGEDAVDPVEEERRQQVKRQQEKALQILGPASAPARVGQTKPDHKPRPPPQKRQITQGGGGGGRQDSARQQKRLLTDTAAETNTNGEGAQPKEEADGRREKEEEAASKATEEESKAAEEESKAAEEESKAAEEESKAAEEESKAAEEESKVTEAQKERPQENEEQEEDTNEETTEEDTKPTDEEAEANEQKHVDDSEAAKEKEEEPVVPVNEEAQEEEENLVQEEAQEKAMTVVDASAPNEAREEAEPAKEEGETKEKEDDTNTEASPPPPSKDVAEGSVEDGEY